MLYEARHDSGKATVLRDIVLTAGGALGAAMLFAFAWTRLIPALRAARSGISIQAKIIRIETRVDRRGVARPRPVVAFTTSDHQHVVRGDVVSPKCARAVGDDVLLHYLPAEPQKSATMATYPEAVRGVVVVLTLAGLLAAAVSRSHSAPINGMRPGLGTT